MVMMRDGGNGGSGGKWWWTLRFRFFTLLERMHTWDNRNKVRAHSEPGLSSSSASIKYIYN